MCHGFMTHFKGVKLDHSYNLVVNLCYKHIFLDIFFGRAWQALNFSGLFFLTKRQLSALIHFTGLDRLHMVLGG